MTTDVLQLLPVRYPFLFIDRILERTDEKVVCLKNFTINEHFFLGHFPDRPIVPGVILLEAMTQTGGLLFSSKNRCYLMQVKNAKFIKFAVPGDQVIMYAKKLSELERFGQVEVEAKVNDAIVAKAFISYAFDV